MVALKYLLIVLADGMFVASFAIVLNDVWMRLGGKFETELASAPAIPWKTGVAIGALAWIPLLLAMLIASVAG